ncbi:MAG: glycerol-3-phosphate 1-O-acyltransferase PlsY [Bacteroidales bacterium]|jgi:glycerol-3-phosphate acyltransferase PlsY|nr:glycerol-3-phosphate 1-O-acyltransferase PlsY [Bacteroidales bacterium]
MVLYIILAVLIAYLLGSIPSAVWFGKLFYGTDVREYGSGNSGATNVFRVLGYKAGIPVLAFDVFKGWLAIQLVNWFPVPGLQPDPMVYIKIGVAVAVFLGHVFPLYAGFRGGKGVGTLAGVAIALYPLALLVVVGVFILIFAITRYVSLSSILAALSFPFIVIFISGERNFALIGLAVLVAIVIPVTHRKNIKRLLHGEERKIVFKRKDGQSQT